MTTQPSRTFAEEVARFQSKVPMSMLFSAACEAILEYEASDDIPFRLTVLYILYCLYADEPLERNPFLTFFLEFVDDENGGRGTPVERQIVLCILNGTIHLVDEMTPQQVCEESPKILPVAKQNEAVVAKLKKAVSRLVEDPWDTGSTKQTNQHTPQESNATMTDYDHHGTYLAQNLMKIQQLAELDTNGCKVLSDMINAACMRSLTIPEQQFLQNAIVAHPNALILCNFPAHRLPDLIENNHLLAIEILPTILTQRNHTDYLEALANVPVTSNCIEVVHHLVTEAVPYESVKDFLHDYISNCIRSCELLDEGPWKDRQVRTVAKFLQSLLEKGIIPIAEYVIEIQVFCVSYFRFRGVTVLYQTASQQAQLLGVNTCESQQAGSSLHQSFA